jgi:pimeloyl-ACP methyl ester carboxylesterase
MRGWLEHIDQHGMRSWARATMPPRMGSAMPPQGIEWWVELMGSNAASTAHAYARWVSRLDMRPDLGKIECPVLVISPDTSATRRNREHSDEYRRLIRDSEFVVIPGDGYHPAATDPDACAIAAREFITRRSH